MVLNGKVAVFAFTPDTKSGRCYQANPICYYHLVAAHFIICSSWGVLDCFNRLMKAQWRIAFEAVAVG
jgi:hypothetical protein